jgi:DNA processing protein
VAGATDPNPRLAREKRELIALMSLSGIGPGRLNELLTTFGSPAAAWDAVREGAAAGPASSSPSWSEQARRTDPAGMASRFEAAGIAVTVRGEKGYPAPLAEIHSPPLVLFSRGELPTSPGVAVVGARKASPYGLEVSRVLAEGLALAGLCIVSGAAYGIDAAAHEGAIGCGGTTVAVLGCGVDVVYPRSNARLYQRVISRGAIVSEYIPGTEPRPHQFPARNRIIAGLSRAVVVVEAGRRSGALITAEFALGEGRDVMAVPGQVFSSNSTGTHALIRSGAALVTCADDVLEELGVDRLERPADVDTPDMSDEQLRLLAELEGGPRDLEGLCAGTRLPTSRAMALLSSMEVSGLVARCAGGTYQSLRGMRGGSHSSRK